MGDLEMAMALIAGAGDSKSYSMEAISHAREGDYTAARACIGKAKEALAGTHDIQTDLIRNEMTGGKYELTLLMTHAQDHLNSALLMRDMAEEFINLYEKLTDKSGR